MSPLFFKRLSDEVLGSRLASGEAAAFDELYRRYANRLAAYGSHLLGDVGLGDDVAQATMLKAYGALREGRVPNRMKPWLFRIAHNVAIDLVVRRRELPFDDVPESPSIDREPFAGTLVEALATLPDRQRRVYVLREVHGLRIDETAAELELTAAQVEQALFAARNRLAEQLVFGDRLNCVTVQRLAAGPLDTSERRALKTHLRTCNSCRQTLGLRGRALSLFPAGMSLDWLPRLGAGLLTGGGAPAAAKIGAVVATATIAAGVPVAVEHTTRSHAHRPAVPRAAQHQTPVVSIRRAAPKAVEAVAHLAPPAVHTTKVVAHESSHESARRKRRHGDESTVTRVGRAVETEHREARSGRERSGHDGSSSGSRSGRDGSGDDGRTTIASGSGSGDDHSGDRRSGRDGGGGATTATSGDGGDRHGGRTTTTAPVVKTESDNNGGLDTSGGGSNDGGGGDSHSGGGDSGSGSGSGGSGGGDDSHGGGGGDDGGTVTVTTPDLALTGP